MAKDKSKKLATLVALSLILLVAWYISDMFLPVYKWLHVDMKAESLRTGIPQEVLEQEYDFIMRYRPRGRDDRDPAAWEILSMSPEWFEGNSDIWEREDEYEATVRCIFMSDRTGRGPAKIFIGGLDKDRYFKCKGYRLKPGAFGNTSPRPVVFYFADTFEKLDSNQSFHFHNRVKFEDMDDFSDRYLDDFDPVEMKLLDEEAAEAAELEAELEAEKSAE